MVLEGDDDDVADDVGEPGHALGELAGLGDRLGAVGEEVVEEVEDGLGAGGVARDLALARRAAEAGGGAGLAVHVPAELEVVGQDEVGEGAKVALELGRLLDLGERGVDVLGLDVADGEQAGGGAAADGEVGGAALDVGGLVRGDGLAADALDEGLEGRAVGVLGRVARPERVAELAEIGVEGIRHGGGPLKPVGCRHSVATPPL